MISDFQTLATGLSFPEGPRWHDGRLFFSDFYRHEVLAMDAAGGLEVIATVEQQPSGLGWLPNGDMLIVSMIDRRLLRLDHQGVLSDYADLGGVATWHCNDMVVDHLGRAYVGNFGFDTHGGVAPTTADLAMVDVDGVVTVAAKGLWFPNGSVITPDGKTLTVGETRASCLTAFDISESGALSNRRVWADLGTYVPDGICLDAEGAIWVADPRAGCVIRVVHGGEITQKLDAGRGAFACMLGGETGDTLYVCTATGSGLHAKDRREGQIDSLRVDVPGAGLP